MMSCRNPRVRVLALLCVVSGFATHPDSVRAQTPSESEASGETLSTVTVTARRRDESLARVPVSLTVFTADDLQSFNIQTFTDYASKTPNLSFTYGQGPTGIADARTISIRGITGQNLGGTGGATGFYIDDTPVPSSIDPRVLDLSNIEVLKGPQGTLFGEGSLGGNVRLITNQPSLTKNGLGYMAQAGVTSGGGSANGGGDVIGNLVLSPDRLAVHVVVFANHDAGYLTRTFPTDPASPGVVDPNLAVPRTSVGDQGALSSFGGSISALLKVTDNFDATLRYIMQNSSGHGFPATFAPLPAFTPEYTLDRAFDVQSHTNDQWNLPSLDLKYHVPGWQFASSTSYFYRHTQDVEDSTYGTANVNAVDYAVCTTVTGAPAVPGGSACLPAQPYLWHGEHYVNQFVEELRASFEPWHNLSGTFGAFYSDTRSLFSIPKIYATGLVQATVANTVVGPWPNEVLWFQDDWFEQKDTSVFGELYYKFFDKFNLTLGARQYWLSQHSTSDSGGFQAFTEFAEGAPGSNSESGLNPKAGLSYQATDTTMVYASASKGFRAGSETGPSAFLQFCTVPGLPVEDILKVKSDTVWSYEVGTKVQLPAAVVSVAAFHIDWNNPQQQLALPCGAYFQVNGNKATIDGAEFDMSGHVTPSLSVRVGAGYEKTEMTDPGPLVYAGVPVGSRIAGVPAFTASIGAVYTRELTPTMQGFFAADYSYTGDAISLVVGGGGTQATRPGYSLANLRFGVDFGKSEISLNVRNLTNAKPNLGDIGYVGYAQVNSAGGVIPQVATLPTTTLMLQYLKNF
jgi:outer membrane receptor protein involved in Fe transport